MYQMVFFSVPEEFNFDPVSKSYGEPQRRPEIKSATIEFIAPSEYMVTIKSLSNTVLSCIFMRTNLCGFSIYFFIIVIHF